MNLFHDAQPLCSVDHSAGKAFLFQGKGECCRQEIIESNSEIFKMTEDHSISTALTVQNSSCQASSVITDDDDEGAISLPGMVTENEGIQNHGFAASHAERDQELYASNINSYHLMGASLQRAILSIVPSGGNSSDDMKYDIVTSSGDQDRTLDEPCSSKDHGQPIVIGQQTRSFFSSIFSRTRAKILLSKIQGIWQQIDASESNMLSISQEILIRGHTLTSADGSITIIYIKRGHVYIEKMVVNLDQTEVLHLHVRKDCNIHYRRATPAAARAVDRLQGSWCRMEPHNTSTLVVKGLTWSLTTSGLNLDTFGFLLSCKEDGVPCMGGLKMIIMPDGTLSILLRDGRCFHYLRDMEATAAAFTRSLGQAVHSQRCRKYLESSKN